MAVSKIIEAAFFVNVQSCWRTFTESNSDHNQADHTKEDSPLKKVFKATIVRKSSALDPLIRTERIEMDVDIVAGRLLPGMITEVHFEMDAPKEAIGIPTTALL